MSAEFFAAVKAGDRARVAAMIEADPALLNSQDGQGLGAFIVAKYSRQDAVAEVLLEKGIELDIFAASMGGAGPRVTELLAADRGLINAYSRDGWTPLHLAAFFGHPEIAEALIAQGADVSARSRNGMANTALHAAVAGRHAPVVSLLLAHGADVNARQQGGWTPLHGAAQAGDLESMRLLLERGADREARADNQQSALDLALTHAHREAVELLESRGATTA